MINYKDVGSSLFAIIVLIHTMYPNLEGAAIAKIIQDGSWIGYAIDITFAFILIRFKPTKGK